MLQGKVQRTLRIKSSDKKLCRNISELPVNEMVSYSVDGDLYVSTRNENREIEKVAIGWPF